MLVCVTDMLLGLTYMLLCITDMLGMLISSEKVSAAERVRLQIIFINIRPVLCENQPKCNYYTN